MKKALRSIIWGIIGLLAKLRIVNQVGVAKLKYLEMMHKWPDFNHPRDINEKINWLKFHEDTSLWVICSDKYAVRGFLKSKGLEKYLVKLYGHWGDTSEIEWDSLPDKFIIKPTNGSGDVLICEDKSSLDIKSAEKHLSTLLKKRYGALSAEPHYTKIKPSLIAEELLDSSTQPCGSTSLIDYKIWCFNGKPEYIMCCSNRKAGSLELSVYDLEWTYHPEYIRTTQHYIRPQRPIPRPECLNEMLSVSSLLAEGFPEVRVDLYQVDGKVYFGEMTFTSAGGFMNYYTQDFLNVLGNMFALE